MLTTDVAADTLAAAGTFPTWLITNVPQLVSSCQCSVGVNLDGSKFSCPKSLPRLTRQAQTVLHRFEFLQCITNDKSLKGEGVDGRQLIPIYFLAAGPGQRPMLTRAEHKEKVTEWHMVQQEGQAAAQQPWQQRHRKGAVTAVVAGVLAAVVLTAAAAMVVLKGKRRPFRGTGSEVGCVRTASSHCLAASSQHSRVHAFVASHLTVF